MTTNASLEQMIPQLHAESGCWESLAETFRSTINAALRQAYPAEGQLPVMWTFDSATMDLFTERATPVLEVELGMRHREMVKFKAGIVGRLPGMLFKEDQAIYSSPGLEDASESCADMINIDPDIVVDPDIDVDIDKDLVVDSIELLNTYGTLVLLIDPEVWAPVRIQCMMLLLDERSQPDYSAAQYEQAARKVETLMQLDYPGSTWSNVEHAQSLGLVDLSDAAVLSNLLRSGAFRQRSYGNPYELPGTVAT